jgi:hypothetical protein
MHYMRWVRTGDPLDVRRIVGLTDSERFWQYVETSDGCWLWVGSTSGGYGLFAVQQEGRRRTMQAHRFAYQDHTGERIPEGLELDHLCMVRNCVNPNHLEPVTRLENTRRSNGISRLLGERSECIHGHPFTPENTYRKPDGGRQCVACRRITDARRRGRRAS